MKSILRRTFVFPVLLLIIAVLIHLFSIDPYRVERFYSTTLYEGIARFFRIITGWLPFSIGDLLYGTAALLIVWKLIRLPHHWRNSSDKKVLAKQLLYNLFVWSIGVYIVFNVLWGINYNRKGITYQMGFERDKYTKEELAEVTILLTAEVNRCKTALENKPFPDSKGLFQAASAVYEQASTHYQFLSYGSPSVKPSLFGWLGNYWGFSGYYNPFTGEAQVNMTVPQSTRPFVLVHEIAHQLGYAKENEANFAGYIAATSARDTTFLYAAYFEMFLYANRNLFRFDSLLAKAQMEKLHPGVKADIKELKEYYKKYENPIEPIIRWAYGKYLKANAQPSGMHSYSEVVADLIGYYKKYGRICGLPPQRDL